MSWYTVTWEYGTGGVMTAFRRIRMDLMSSKEVARYLRKKDTVLLPVGCFEMHGPLVPLACDALMDWAGALLLGEKWKVLVMPPIYYTFPGASGPWPGTVDISPEITVAYVKEVVKALLKNGFRKVVLCASHSPAAFMLQSVIRSILQETGQVVIHIVPMSFLMPNDLVQKEFGGPLTEDLYLLGMLKVLGLEEAFDPEVPVERPCEFPSKTIKKLAAFGGTNVAPWLFLKDYQHTGIRKGLKRSDADRALKIVKTALERLDDLPSVYEEYQREISAFLKKRPWTKDDAWTV